MFRIVGCVRMAPWTVRSKGARIGVVLNVLFWRHGQEMGRIDASRLPTAVMELLPVIDGFAEVFIEIPMGHETFPADPEHPVALSVRTGIFVTHRPLPNPALAIARCISLDQLHGR
jgi:hypothetical protein